MAHPSPMAAQANAAPVAAPAFNKSRLVNEPAIATLLCTRAREVRKRHPVLRGDNLWIGLRGFLGALVALSHCLVVWNKLLVDGAPLGRVGLVPRSLEFAKHGIGGHRNDAGLGQARDRGL